MKFFSTLLAAGSFALIGGLANAATENWTPIAGSLCSTTDIDPEAAECFGLLKVKNDSTNVDKAKDGFVDVNLDSFGDDEGLFGHKDWEFAAKIGYDIGEVEVVGSDPVETYTGATFGILSSLVSGYEQIALGFKQGAGSGGSEYAIYLYNSPFPEISTYSLMKFTNTGLSHLSVFGRGQCDDEDGCGGGDTGTVIPLPAAGWLLLGGLGGLAAMRRRNKV